MIQVDVVDLELTEEKCGKFYKDQSGFCYYFKSDMSGYTCVSNEVCVEIEAMEKKILWLKNEEKIALEKNANLTSRQFERKKEIISLSNALLAVEKKIKTNLEKPHITIDDLIKLKESFSLTDIIRLKSEGIL